MKFHVILDGYNLVHSRNFPGKKGRSLESQRDYLVQLIRQYAARTRRHCLVVFDSKIPFSRQTRKYSRVEVRFSPPHKEADHVIQEFIRNSKNPRALLVVSSDREIQHTARAHGAQVMSSESFWASELPARMPPPTNLPAEDDEQKPDGELSEQELQEWLRLFTNDEEDDA